MMIQLNRKFGFLNKPPPPRFSLRRPERIPFSALQEEKRLLLKSLRVAVGEAKIFLRPFQGVLFFSLRDVQII